MMLCQESLDCWQVSKLNRAKFLKFSKGGIVYIEDIEASEVVDTRPINEVSHVEVDLGFH